MNTGEKIMKYTHKSPILQMFLEGRGTADDLVGSTSTLKEKAKEKNSFAF